MTGNINIVIGSWGSYNECNERALRETLRIYSCSVNPTDAVGVLARHPKV